MFLFLILLLLTLLPFLFLSINFFKDQSRHPLMSPWLVNRGQLSSLLKYYTENVFNQCFHSALIKCYIIAHMRSECKASTQRQMVRCSLGLSVQPGWTFWSILVCMFAVHAKLASWQVAGTSKLFPPDWFFRCPFCSFWKNKQIQM